MSMMRFLIPVAAIVLALTIAIVLTISGPAQAQDNPSWNVDAWDIPFDYGSPSKAIAYQPLTKARKPWTLCASYPHLKDSYWLSVNYGMVEEARRLGVRLRVVEAGGYPNVERQIAQVRDCVKDGADVLVLGTAPSGGRVPDEWYPPLRHALGLGMSLVNGLHDRLNELIGEICKDLEALTDLKVRGELAETKIVTTLAPDEGSDFALQCWTQAETEEWDFFIALTPLALYDYLEQ